MLKALRSFTKTLPLLLTAFLLSVTVWIMAVTSSDPSVEKSYPNPVPLEIIGQSPNLVITTVLPEEIALTLRAPNSIWDTLLAQDLPVRAIMDLSGLNDGSYNVPVQVQIGIKPVEIINYAPQSVAVSLETLQTSEYEIRIINQGSLAVGYQSNPAELSETTVLVSGAKSFVEKVSEVRAVVKLTDVKADINQTITLQAVDVNGSVVRDVSLSPEKITVQQKVFERGGYRNVVVKVITNGQVADGYRLSSLSVFPPTVTVYSANTALVDALPGYIETKPIDLSQKSENFDEQIDLNLPEGIQVIDTLLVLVDVEILPIITTQSIADVVVEPGGLDASLAATISPQTVDVIISGPLNALQAINPNDVRVILDLTGLEPGNFTLEPRFSLNYPEIRVESISPTTFNILIE